MSQTPPISTTSHNDGQHAPIRIRLWDLPLRLFHWLLVLDVTIAVVTAKIGGDLMEIHEKAGITMIGLLAFRITWGICGSRYARFVHFFPTPARLNAYFTGQWTGLGHNPLGAISVFVLLALLVAQALSGLFTNDDITFTAPLADLISKERSDTITGWHQELSDFLLIFIGLHVLAIAFYFVVKKNNLVTPMITGWKSIPAKDQPTPAKKGSIVALIMSLLIAVAAMTLASGKIPFGKADTAAPAAPTTPAEPAKQATPSW